MIKRFVVLAPALFVVALAVADEPGNFQSAYLRIEPAKDQPAFVALAVDSLGKRKLGVNALRPPAQPAKAWQLHRNGPGYEYRPAGAPLSTPPAWTFTFSGRHMRLHSSYSRLNPPPPLVLDFDQRTSHATLLGWMKNDGSVRLPAILHIPGQGTFRITSSTRKPPALGYDAFRFEHPQQGVSYIKVTFPGATEATHQIDYNLEVTAIYPGPPQLARDPRFDGFRREWISIFQMNPRRRVLANNAMSDACAFTVYEYSSVAMHTPPLAPGLTALDLVRQTLDRYLSGEKAYGMAGYTLQDTTDYLDTYPSLLMAAWDYVHGSKDEAWLRRNYAGLKEWAARMLAMDADGNGLTEYVASGNSGSWPEKIKLRPSNWWDTIGFGHEDAYSNALTYRALQDMTDLAQRAGHPEDGELYASRAEKLHSVYFDTFYNPATGVLAGWKSADGKLHDYYFTFVNGAAITYGLVPPAKANQIMDRMLAKMRDVGYTHFEYGLPGNLVPIRQADYVDHGKPYGWPTKEDGSDGFQIYENGGATACMTYLTLQALYQLGRRKEADAILFPMLKAFEDGGFQGKGPNGSTYDWKAWDGTPHGYEGLLVDGYQALLAALSR